MLKYPVNLDINSFDSKYLYVRIFCILVFRQYFSYFRKINFGKISSWNKSASFSSLIIELIQLHFMNLMSVILSPFFVQIFVKTKTEIFRSFKEFFFSFLLGKEKTLRFQT